MRITDFERIRAAVEFLDANFKNQPSLSEVALHVGLSDFHFQRLFRRWAGISPKKFLEFATASYAWRLLQSSRSVLDAAFEAGLSGPGRLHDLMINVYAATPGEAKEKGEGLVIQYGWHSIPFGACFLATTQRGICALSFVQEKARPQILGELKRRWAKARFAENPRQTRRLLSQVFDVTNSRAPLNLHLAGTNFQLKVWEALIRMPLGTVATYEDIAETVGCRRAQRAVGSALACNPVAFLIPCHRIIRKTGAFGNYRWGTARKRAIVIWETAVALRQGAQEHGRIRPA
jgi:AraC family transcriptional regulator of adaptative response/methylated-DNA-[protein]-cysteine methyltransferase